MNGVATTGWPWSAISISPSLIGPSSRSGEFVLMIVISDGSRAASSRDTPRTRRRDLERVVDHDPPRPEAVPRLVELGGEDPVLVEVARLDRQVGRLERPATLLVDDVERADQPHVVGEVGDVARSPTTVEVAHEGRPADRAEHEVRAAEHDVALRVSGVQPELARRQRDQRFDLGRVEAHVP